MLEKVGRHDTEEPLQLVVAENARRDNAHVGSADWSFHLVRYVLTADRAGGSGKERITSQSVIEYHAVETHGAKHSRPALCISPGDESRAR